MAAFSNATPAIVEVLLEAGAEVNSRDEHGFTPLHCAAWSNGNVEVTELLLQSGAAVNAPNSIGATPLHAAAKMCEFPAVVRALLRAGANTEARENQEQTPLHWAAQASKSPEIVKVLLEAGANFAARDVDEETPLDIARRSASSVFGAAPGVIEQLHRWVEDVEFPLSRAKAETRRAVRTLAMHRADLPFSEAEFALSFSAYIEWIKLGLMADSAGDRSMFDAPNVSARSCAIEFIAKIVQDVDARSEIQEAFPNFLFAMEHDWAHDRATNELWHVSLTRALIIGCRGLAYARTGHLSGGVRLHIPDRVTLEDFVELSREWLVAEIGPHVAAQTHRIHVGRA